jgi:hypothetical protein
LNTKEDLMKTSSQRTNVKGVTDLMEFARSGPLMQAFILEAIRRYACQVADADLADLDSPLISGAAWRRCGREALDAIDSHLGAPAAH